MVGIIPTGAGNGGIVTDATNTTAPASQTFVNGAYATPTFVAWNATPSPISAPGSYLIPVATGGSTQATTPATSPCTPCYNQSTDRTNYQYTLPTGGGGAGNMDFEFVVVGNKVSIAFQCNGINGAGYFDTQVYVEHEGVFKKAKNQPVFVMSATNGGIYYRHLEFDSIRPWRVRVALPAQAWFLGLYANANANIYAPKQNVPTFVADGDSYFEPAGNSFDSGIYGTSGNATSGMISYMTFGTVDGIAEATGWWPIRIAEGGTGYFNIGNGSDSPDTYYDVSGYGHFSEFGSLQRIANYQNKFANRLPIVYIMNGTQNDGIGVVATMKARAKLVYNRIRAVDPIIPILQIGNEANLRFGINYSQTGACALDDQGMQQAIAELPWSGFVKCQPTDNALLTGWWTDITGGNIGSTNNSPATSVQAQMIGPNGLHPCWLGAKNVGNRDAGELANLAIPTIRAYGTG
jgi:hypothetical protein